MSASVHALVSDMPVGAGIRDGPMAGSRLEEELATAPAWPTWAEMAAPSAWTASVSLRNIPPSSIPQWYW